MSRTLFLIDGRYQIYRGHFGMRPLTNSAGMQVQAIYVITDLLLRLCRDHDVSHWAVAMECDGPTFRHQMYDQYKANRDAMPEELRTQLPYIDRMLEAFRVPILKSDHHEADDCLATMSRLAEIKDMDVRLLTRDKDLEQVISPRVQFLDEKNWNLYGPDELLEKKGIRPDQVISYQTLVGDSSDNIPGVAGVGPKTAVKILDHVEAPFSLLNDPVPDGIPASALKKVRANPDAMTLSKELVTLSLETPLQQNPEDLARIEPDHETLADLFRELGFRRFLKMLEPAEKVEADLFSGFDSPPATAEPTRQKASTAIAEKVDYKYVDTFEKLDAVIEACRSEGRFAFDTETNSLDSIGGFAVGCSIAVQEAEAWYIPFYSPTNNCPLPKNEVLERLRPILEDPSIGKIGQNMKFDAQVMRTQGIEIQGISGDPMIAAYLVNSLRGRYGLDDLVGERLGHSMISIKSLIGSGNDQISMDQIEPEKITEYAAEDADFTLRLSDNLRKDIDDNDLARVYDEIELPLIEVLTSMEREGISLDEKRLSEQEETLTEELNRLESEIHEEAGGPFNIGSPKQLQKVLFEDLKLPTKGLPKTKTGVSVKAETLEELSIRHPEQILPTTILRHRSLAKLLSTYVQALPQHLHPVTRRIHTDFRQTVTATGRLASNRPNLQNIPIRSEEGRRIRKAFVPNREGCIFVSADYSQVELRLLAHLTADEGLLQAIHDGVDIHASVAARIHGKTHEEVTKDERAAAKAVNFGLMYGMGAFGLSRDLSIPVAEAKQFIEDYFQQFPAVQSWMEQTKLDAAKTGEVRTLYGRRRPVPEILSRVAREKAQGERYAINSVVQGSAADMIKLAMIEVHRQCQLEDRDCRLLLQIHDELLLEVPIKEVENCRQWLRDAMIHVMDLSVPLEVEVNTGKDWFDASK